MVLLPRYKLPVDEDLTSILSIELAINNSATTQRTVYGHALNYHTEVPLKEVVALFREIEGVINYKETKPCTIAIKVGPGLTVNGIKVYSMKVFEPITKLPAPMVVKIWNMLFSSKK